MLDHRTSQLTGLLLPLADRHLVLPNVAIAELIDFQRGEPASDAPPWYLRQVTWRDQQLPLISFEAVCGEAAVTGERSRIVVLNALGSRRFARLNRFRRTCTSVSPFFAMTERRLGVRTSHHKFMHSPKSCRKNPKAQQQAPSPQ